MLLANFGIFCRILKRRAAGQRVLPDGKGGKKLYDCKADYELIIGSASRAIASWKRSVSSTTARTQKYREWRRSTSRLRRAGFVSAHCEIEHVGREAVFDTTQT